MQKNQGELTVRQAGHRGGLAVLQKYGRKFYVEIGKKGQQTTRTRYHHMAREWGKLGGRPRKPSIDEMGEGSK